MRATAKHRGVVRHAAAERVGCLENTRNRIGLNPVAARRAVGLVRLGEVCRARDTRLERLNGESRRRTKVIPRFPTERSCLTLLYASLVTASKRWRGVPMTAAILRQLQTLRTTSSASAEEAVA